jgi:hypothetical protein
MESAEWSKEHRYGSAKGINSTFSVSLHGALHPRELIPNSAPRTRAIWRGLLSHRPTGAMIAKGLDGYSLRLP